MPSRHRLFYWQDYRHDRWDQITLTNRPTARTVRQTAPDYQPGLSPSAFHHQFKAVTSMTPLQYQKKLRLLEARRMIPAQRMKVGSAAYATGYESPSQFSREYARMCGLPPKQDATTRPWHWRMI
ncbi:helix-turn-helix transcriptional regulator [Klebsiella sp. NPDC088457]